MDCLFTLILIAVWFQRLLFLSKRKIFGRAIRQAVSHRSVTAEIRVRARVSLYGIRGGQSGTGAGSFFPESFDFPMSISLRTYIKLRQ
jgi:hypothetical protein